MILFKIHSHLFTATPVYFNFCFNITHLLQQSLSNVSVGRAYRVVLATIYLSGELPYLVTQTQTLKKIVKLKS